MALAPHPTLPSQLELRTWQGSGALMPDSTPKLQDPWKVLHAGAVGHLPARGARVQPEEGVLPPAPQNGPHQFPPLANRMCFRAEGIRRVQLRHWCGCRWIGSLLQTLRTSLCSSLPLAATCSTALPLHSGLQGLVDNKVMLEMTLDLLFLLLPSVIPVLLLASQHPA